MKFKVGDRVKFLDENGGGIISKVVSHSMVNVAIEDGFEIPTLISNLIKEEVLQSSFKSPIIEKNTAFAESEEEEDARIQANPRLRGGKEMPEGVYLAFVPQDQKWLMTGKFDLFLVNQSSWEILFSLFLASPGKPYQGKDYDIVPASSRIHLASIKPERLENWSKGTLQFLFRKDETEKLLLPTSIDFNIKGFRFLNEASYMEYSFMEGKAFVVNLIPISAVGQTGKALAAEAEEQKAKPQEADEIINEYRSGDREALVDLHIHELMEDSQGLGKHELFNIQVGHFLACLESGIRAKYRKITFIHGRGEGKLREEIESRLQNYSGIEFEDAPMKDYGRGAITIRISGKAAL